MIDTSTPPAGAALLTAVELQNRGELQAARDAFLAIVADDPRSYLAHYSLGVIESNQGHNAGALTHFDRAVDCNPRFLQGWLARSIVHLGLGNHAAALRDVEHCLRERNDWPEAERQRSAVNTASGSVAALINQGIAWHNTGRVADARALFLQVLQTDAANFPALYSLGVIASQQGEHTQAVGWFSRAIEAQPGNASAHFSKGSALQSCGLYEAALSYYDEAIRIDPAFESSYANKSALLHHLGRQREALSVTEASLAVNPDNTRAMNNRGYLLTEFKQFSAASQVFQALLERDADYEFAPGLKLFAQLHACDWSTYETDRTRIIEGIRADKPVMNPLAFNAITDRLADIHLCAQGFHRRRYPAQPRRLWNGEAYVHRKRRVALISADFREHPVGYLLIGLLEQMARKRIELYAISLGVRDRSTLEKRFRYSIDNFLDCSEKNADEIAAILRNLEIDVALDLSGYTSGSRIEVFSWRPAPIQATWLGYPGTLGTGCVDYLIADAVTVPGHLEQHYSESVVRLPHCYLPRDTEILIPDRESAASMHALPEHEFVYASFNHDYKINPGIFAVWMQLLNETPGSLLWLMRLNDDAHGNILREAAAAGIDPSRILFATRVPRIEDHLARYRLVDVALDTFPYNGHTTTSDALMAGCPVITLSGESFASRVAGSLLHDAGLEELIATDTSGYRDRALRFAQDREYARSIRERLAATLASGAWPPSAARQAEAVEELLYALVPRPS